MNGATTTKKEVYRCIRKNVCANEDAVNRHSERARKKHNLNKCVCRRDANDWKHISLSFYRLLVLRRPRLARRLHENIRAHLRLYLMAVIVHGLHASSKTRRICSRPTSASAAASSSSTFLICLVRRWIFPIILAFPSVKFIHHT